MPLMYEDEAMAKGYARHRPALHPLIIAEVRNRLRWHHPVAWALDVGCGSGLSMAPLTALAERCIGLEPAAPMLKWARTIAPGGAFVCAKAEHLPFPERAFDLITAAGSLNYVDVACVLPELARVMKRDGTLIVYDFTHGRSFADSDRLDAWFEAFTARYPRADDGWRPITRESLKNDARGVRLKAFEPFTQTLTYDAASYSDYAMTESNVRQAISNGHPAFQIRNWCEQSLRQVFQGESKAVVFQGYIAYLQIR